ncbi:MAG: hypothetical protein WKF68_04685 [Daejeonella sp.]
MMNKKEIFKKVGGIVSELHEQYEYLSQGPDNLNELELELFSANANFLSDHIAILVKLNNNAGNTGKSPIIPATLEGSVSDRSADAEHRFNLPLVGETEDELRPGDPDARKESALDFETETTAKPADLPLTSGEKGIIGEETTFKTGTASEEDEYEAGHKQNTSDEGPVIKEVTISERTIAIPAEQTLQDSPVPTVNDLLSKNAPAETLGSQFNSRQVRDLKSMISLNDKLLFVRDLFNGYSLAYSEAIELLNRFDSVEAAENFLKQNYAAKNNWKDKQDVAEKFYELLGRRFAR